VKAEDSFSNVDRGGSAMTKQVRIMSMIAIFSLLATVLRAAPTQFQHIIGTGDLLWDPIDRVYVTVRACDTGVVMDSGLKHNVCSVDGNFNSDGGVYHPPAGQPYRSFRRNDPLPGQSVSFVDTPIPFGYPAVQSTTGDTYVTTFFTTSAGDQKGIYGYSYSNSVMSPVVDTTPASFHGVPNQPGFLWTDFSMNVAVSPAGAFFKGASKYNGMDNEYQGIYQYTAGQLRELVPFRATVPMLNGNQVFTSYTAVAANSTTVLFVGEFSIGKGIYAYNLSTRALRKVIDTYTAVPGGGTFTDFSPVPSTEVHGDSMVLNETGSIAVVADYRSGLNSYRGLFLLTPQGSLYQVQRILSTGTNNPALLNGPIEDIHTVSINSRGELAFVVTNDDQPALPNAGLVFYRTGTVQSVFKTGDSFLAELKHPSSVYQTNYYGGLVSGSQALDSANPPHIYFRHFYRVNGYSLPFVMMVVGTMNPAAN
jgi:hypothetical protein